MPKKTYSKLPLRALILLALVVYGTGQIIAQSSQPAANQQHALMQQTADPANVAGTGSGQVPQLSSAPPPPPVTQNPYRKTTTPARSAKKHHLKRVLTISGIVLLVALAATEGGFRD